MGVSLKLIKFFHSVQNFEHHIEDDEQVIVNYCDFSMDWDYYDFEEFVNMWDGQIMEPSSKRMIIFAPDTYPWRDIAENCESVFMIPSQAGKGLAEVHYDTIISNIVNSIG